MPLYEFLCKKCGTKFEELVGSYTPAAMPCPSCDNKETEKLMSAAGIISHSSSPMPSCPSAAACSASGSAGCCGGSCPMG